MPEYVRVKDPVSGAEYDAPKSRLAVCPDLKVLDKPTGAPPKSRLALGTPLPGGEVDRRRKRATTKTAAAGKPRADRNDGPSVTTEKEK